MFMNDSFEDQGTLELASQKTDCEVVRGADNGSLEAPVQCRRVANSLRKGWAFESRRLPRVGAGELILAKVEDDRGALPLRHASSLVSQRLLLQCEYWSGKTETSARTFSL